MTIAASNVAPSFLGRQRITSEDLRKLDEPCAVFEHHWFDADGVPCWAYTVGGFLRGKPVGGPEGGATIGGDVIIVNAQTRDMADTYATYGLLETISAVNHEAAVYLEALKALTRLNTLNAVRRLELQTAAEKNADFQKDSKALELLRGDDIVLGAGGMEH